MDAAALELVRHHVIRAEQIVARQERIVEAGRKVGCDTRNAETLLDTFRHTLQEMRAHLAWEESSAASAAR